jgi:hypothetical protein
MFLAFLVVGAVRNAVWTSNGKQAALVWAWSFLVGGVVSVFGCYRMMPDGDSEGLPGESGSGITP